jgi:hypothetical protein
MMTYRRFRKMPLTNQMQSRTTPAFGNVTEIVK